MFNPYLRSTSQSEFLQRSAIESEIERLIALLDALDGDPDCHDISDFEAEPDDEANNDSEPGTWTEFYQNRRTCLVEDENLEDGGNFEDEPDDEANGDDEPWLGRAASGGLGNSYDLELEAAE